MLRISLVCLLQILATPLLFAPAGEPATEATRSKAYQLNTLYLEALAKGDNASALDALNEAIRLDPGWDVTYHNRACFLFLQGDMVHALSDCEMALKLSKTPPSRYYRARSAVYEEISQFDKAIADAKKAIELDPNDQTLHGQLGRVYAHAHQWKNAIEECSTALKGNPECYYTLVIRGAARCKDNDSKRGMADFRKAVQINPKETDAYMERANALLENGEDAEALKDCDRVLASKPRNYREIRNHADVHCLRGRIHRNKGETGEALADYSEAVRIYPKHFGALHDRGQIYGERGEYNKAVADFTELVRHWPDDSRGYEFRALAYFALGSTAAAAADQRKAEALGKVKSK